MVDRKKKVVGRKHAALENMYRRFLVGLSPTYPKTRAATECKTGCANMRCTCNKNGLSCTTACGECRGISCENAMHLDDSTLSDEE